MENKDYMTDKQFWNFINEYDLWYCDQKNSHETVLMYLKNDIENYERSRELFKNN